jgi:hypothetical protein
LPNEPNLRPLTDDEVRLILDAIGGAEDDEAMKYSSAVFPLVRVAKEKEDAALEEWVRLIARVFVPSVGALKESGMEANTFWVNPKTLTDPQVELLKTLVERVNRPAALARLADYVWLARSDHTYARRAVDEYVKLAKEHENDESWMATADYYDRALRLSARLGRGPLFQQVVGAVDELLRRLNGEDPRFLSVKLMEALIETRAGGDATTYAALAEKGARRAEEEAAQGDRSKYNVARQRWIVAAEWHRLRHDDVAENAARAAFGETYIQEGELVATSASPDFGVAATMYGHGIGALRRLQNQKERVSSLLARYKELQRRGVSEMKPIGGKVDLTECVAAARKRVASLSLDDAIVALADILPIPSVDALRKDVLESAKTFISDQLFPTIMVNDEGAPLAGFGPLDPDADEANHALKSRMFKDLRQGRVVTVFGFIEPARDQIVHEHVITAQPFLRLASLSEFIPRSRESIWAFGLQAGMMGDFLTATHVLVPQVEHSIRILLVRSGKVPVAWTKQGYEELPDLNAVLRDPQTTKILGEDLVFALTAVFVNRFGGNLRNDLAHGLLETSAFYGETAVYAWWLLLKCVVAFGRIEEGQGR